MSYILEALKKSDQQRQRSVTPTLLTAHVPVTAPAKPVFLYYGLLAAVLLSAGISIGWLHPWQTDTPATDPIVMKPLEPVTRTPVPAPLPVASEIAEKSRLNPPIPSSTPAMPATPMVATQKPDTPAPSTEKAINTGLADKTQEQKIVPVAELPLTIQQEIPAMTIPLHAYSSKPKDRLVSINGRMLREGEALTPDLRLEQITPEGMIFNYKGYRFRRGVQ